MQLLLVRHGRTKLNREQRYLGALDPPLDATGIAQAKALCGALPASIDALLCSPLRRARQTADILARHLGLPVVVDEAFRERHVGVFEGLTQAQARQQFPALWQRNITRQWHAAPDGGETIAAVFERIHAGVDALLSQHEHANVLLVAHGFVAKVIRAIALSNHNDLFDWQLENAAICTLQLRRPLPPLLLPTTDIDARATTP